MRLPYILMLLMLLSLSSCFELVEEIEMGKDGSGSYLFTVNMSQSKTKLSNIMRLDSINGRKVPDQADIEREFNKVVTRAKGVEGITNVKKSSDFDEFIFTFSCDFKHLENLNALAVDLSGGYAIEGREVPSDHFSYDAKTKTMSRQGEYSMKSDFESVSDTDKLILDGAMYTTIFRTDAEIKSASNPTSKISPNKKALLFRVPILDLVNEREDIGNTIQLN